MKKITTSFLFLTLLFSCKPKQDYFQFEKIVYHTSACFGRCPVVHLEITKDKTARLHGEAVYSKTGGTIDASRTGYFTGVVADTAFHKLMTELRKIGLDTVKFGGPNCCDGATKTIIVYYNGKRKYLRAMFPPDHAFPMLSALNDIYSTGRFEKAEETFELEYDSIP